MSMVSLWVVNMPSTMLCIYLLVIFVWLLTWYLSTSSTIYLREMSCLVSLGHQTRLSWQLAVATRKCTLSCYPWPTSMQVYRWKPLLMLSHLQHTYLPIPKFLNVSVPVHAALTACVYHTCISIIVKDLKKVGSPIWTPLTMPHSSCVMDHWPSGDANDLWCSSKSVADYTGNTTTIQWWWIPWCLYMRHYQQRSWQSMYTGGSFACTRICQSLWMAWAQQCPPAFLVWLGWCQFTLLPDTWCSPLMAQVHLWSSNQMDDQHHDWARTQLSLGSTPAHGQHMALLPWYNQVTGQEHCELQKVIVVVISGAVDDTVLASVQATLVLGLYLPGAEPSILQWSNPCCEQGLAWISHQEELNYQCRWPTG